MATYKADPLITGEHIAGQQYQAQLGLPKKQDVDAELYKDIRASLGEKPRGWRAIASGFTKGLEQGSKLSALEERKKDLEKYNRVMNYFEEVNNNALERKQEYEIQDQAQKAALPFALSYYKNYPNYDPISQKAAMQKIVDITNRITGDDIEIQSVDGADGTQATAIDRNTGETVFFNLNQVFPEEALQMEAAQSLPSYQLKLQEQRHQQALENQQRQEQLDIQRFNAETGRLGAKNKSISQQNFLSKEENKRLVAEEMEKNTYLRLYELLKEGDPTVSSLPGANLSRKIASNIPVIGGVFREGLNPQQEYKELVADLKGQKFKKFGYRNQAEFENIHTLSPDLPRDEALKFVENKLKQIGVDLNEVNNNQNAKIIIIKNPETGETKPIEEKYLSKALDAGWTQ